MDKPSVLVVIVNYRTSELIPNLLQSIQEPGMDLTIAILDNASIRDTLEPLEQIRDERLHLLHTPVNMGFTGGINHVIRTMLQHGQQFDYLFLFNPDAVSKPGLIGELARLLQQHEQAACISPRINNINGQSWYQGGTIHFPKGKVLMEPATATNQQVRTTEVFNGCAALFRMAPFLEAGMFNEDLFMYYDEADLSIRLQQVGCTILYAPNIEVLHDVSYTTRNISHLKTYYMTRNRFMVFGRHMHLRHKVGFLIWELAYHLKNKRLRNALYHLRGFADFTKGKAGILKHN